MLRRAIPLLLLTLVAVISTRYAWTSPISWTPDGLFYEARALELQGQTQPEAMFSVLTSPSAAAPLAQDARNPPERRLFSDPRRVAYMERATQRRVLVPALAAVLAPALGGTEKALLAVSLFGYMAVGWGLYFFLRRRFSVGVSGLVSLLCLLLPPLRMWSFHPLTDSMGLALEIVALLAATLVLDRGLRWLPAWIVSLAALSFTRDAAAVLLAAVAWETLRTRAARPALLLVSGIAAALPASLRFPTPARDAATFAVANFRSGYWPQLRATLRQDLFADTIHPNQLAVGALLLAATALLLLRPSGNRPGLRRRTITACTLVVFAVPGSLLFQSTAGLYERVQVPVALLFLVGLVLLALPLAPADASTRLARAGACACVGYLALFLSPSGMRLELVFLPFVAFGLARAAVRWPRHEPQPAPTILASLPAEL